MDGGQRVDAQVDVLLLQADVRAAVLGDTALGCVHAAHDLHTRDDGSLQLLRHGEDGAQHAVNAHAHMQVGLARLQVDVGRALGSGSLDDAVHQAHRGGGLRVGVVAQRGGLEAAPVVGAGGAGVALHLLDGAGGALVAVQRHDGAHDRVVRGHHGHDALAGGVLHRLDGHEVQRVAHGQVHVLGRGSHGHHVVLPGHVLRHHAAHLGVEVDGGKVHELDAQLHLQRLDELRLRDDALGDELVAQAPLRLLLLRERMPQLLIGDEPRIGQHVSQALVCHCYDPILFTVMVVSAYTVVSVAFSGTI